LPARRESNGKFGGTSERLLAQEGLGYIVKRAKQLSAIYRT